MADKMCGQGFGIGNAAMCELREGHGGDHDNMDFMLGRAARDLSPADLLELYKYLADKFAANLAWGSNV